MKFAPEPIVILGAARSGTKMLRALLSSHPDVTPVPWDVNFIWKHGNYDVPHDELVPEQLTSRSRRFIARTIRRHGGAGPRIVEKTVGNTLRPEFVHAVFPDAYFIHLIRDGRDVAESARRMWRAPMDRRAVLQKLRAFPLAALPTYGLQYARAYLERGLGHRDGSVSTWGPRWRGIDQDVRARSLLEVCAIQWRRSVEASLAGLATMDPERVVEVRYEELCANPVQEAERLLSFAKLSPSRSVRDYAAQKIVSRNVKKAQDRLTAGELGAISRHAGPLLASLGYVGSRES